MPFFKVPFLLVLFLVIFTGGRAIPFLLLAFGVWMLLGVVRQSARYEPRPIVSTGDLEDLRNDVAVALLDLDADERIMANPEARARYRSAGQHYTKASRALDRGLRRRDRTLVANTLYEARYELEAASAELDGRPAPDPPAAQRPQRQPVAVYTYPRHRRRYACYW